MLTWSCLVRVAAKELTSLILDDERLRAERSDRRTWKSRVAGLDEYGPQHHEPPARRERPRRADFNEEDDTEYRLALEASKVQEEEDRRKRESRQAEDDDDDLAKAIKLSKEEEERRRRELEDTNASSLFDDEPSQSTSQPQFTGFNGGYQQGSAVDFFANPIDQNQMMAQPTGYPMTNAFTGYQQQQTGYQYPNGFGVQPTGFDAFGQQQVQPQLQQQSFAPQPTGYNPYAQQQQFQQLQPQVQEPVQPAGSNNPWATNNTQTQSLKPMPTGSNNPFAQQQQTQQPSNRPSPFKSTSTLLSLPEQKTLSTFPQSTPSFNIPQQQPQAQPQREQSEHEARLNALLASGDGMDTFGNTGNLRIPAQHTAPGTFVNSAGAGLNRLTADATGNNPFLRQQYTGMPTVTYGQQPAATGPAGMNGFGQGTNNPFAGRQQQSQQGQGDLIQF